MISISCGRLARKLASAQAKRGRANMPAEPKPMTETQPGAETTTGSLSLLDRIILDGRIGQTDQERTAGKLWLKDLVQDVMTGQMTVSKDTEAMINSRVADLDALR